MLTEAEKRAHAKYLKKLDDIRVRAPKGTKEMWRDHAARNGQSLAKFVMETVNERCAQESE